MEADNSSESDSADVKPTESLDEPSTSFDQPEPCAEEPMNKEIKIEDVKPDTCNLAPTDTQFVMPLHPEDPMEIPADIPTVSALYVPPEASALYVSSEASEPVKTEEGEEFTPEAMMNVIQYVNSRDPYQDGRSKIGKNSELQVRALELAKLHSASIDMAPKSLPKVDLSIVVKCPVEVEVSDTEDLCPPVTLDPPEESQHSQDLKMEEIFNPNHPSTSKAEPSSSKTDEASCPPKNVAGIDLAPKSLPKVVEAVVAQPKRRVEVEVSDMEDLCPPTKKRHFIPSGVMSPVTHDCPEESQHSQDLKMEEIFNPYHPSTSKAEPSSSKTYEASCPPKNVAGIPDKSSLAPLPEALHMDIDLSGVDCILGDGPSTSTAGPSSGNDGLTPNSPEEVYVPLADPFMEENGVEVLPQGDTGHDESDLFALLRKLNQEEDHDFPGPMEECNVSPDIIDID